MQRYKQRSLFFLILGEKLNSDDDTNLFQPCVIIIELWELHWLSTTMYQLLSNTDPVHSFIISWRTVEPWV